VSAFIVSAVGNILRRRVIVIEHVGSKTENDEPVEVWKVRTAYRCGI
jgi:hypothetical protein